MIPEGHLVLEVLKPHPNSLRCIKIIKISFTIIDTSFSFSIARMDFAILMVFAYKKGKEIKRTDANFAGRV